MWVARFKLKDDEDIYSPVCVENNINLYALPYTNFEKKGKINLILGAIMSGSENNKEKFLSDLRKDRRVKKIERYHDFLLLHAQHPISRESRAEIKIFYNPEYLRIKPVHVAPDGWEYWEVACLDRVELNKLINTAVKHYHGVLSSIKEETLRDISILSVAVEMTEKQIETLKLAYREGYYNYPKKLTLKELAKKNKKSYSTVQEHLSKAENKVMDFFLKYNTRL